MDNGHIKREKIRFNAKSWGFINRNNWDGAQERISEGTFQYERWTKKSYSDVLFSDEAVAFPSLSNQDSGAKTDFSLP